MSAEIDFFTRKRNLISRTHSFSDLLFDDCWVISPAACNITRVFELRIITKTSSFDTYTNTDTNTDTDNIWKIMTVIHKDFTFFICKC